MFALSSVFDLQAMLSLGFFTFLISVIYSDRIYNILDFYFYRKFFFFLRLECETLICIPYFQNTESWQWAQSYVVIWDYFLLIYYLKCNTIQFTLLQIKIKYVNICNYLSRSTCRSLDFPEYYSLLYMTQPWNKYINIDDIYSGFIEGLSLCVPGHMMDKISLCKCAKICGCHNHLEHVIFLGIIICHQLLQQFLFFQGSVQQTLQESIAQSI